MVESIDMDYKIAVFAVDIEGKYKHLSKDTANLCLKSQRSRYVSTRNNNNACPESQVEATIVQLKVHQSATNGDQS